MKNSKLLFVSFICLSTAVAMAQSGDSSSDELFRARETSVDAFGTISVGQRTIDNLSGNRIGDDGELGAGVGLNHFYTRYLGLGADAYSENTDGGFIDNASANVILRLPIDDLHLAPYVFGGGGYQFEPGEVAFGQAGAGLELRFNRDFGIFADTRYVMTDGTENFGVGRAGVRLAF